MIASNSGETENDYGNDYKGNLEESNFKTFRASVLRRYQAKLDWESSRLFYGRKHSKILGLVEDTSCKFCESQRKPRIRLPRDCGALIAKRPVI